MQKEVSNPGKAVDAGGNPVVDPTANVLKLVEEAVKRINDLHAQESKFRGVLRKSDSRRIDDLRHVEIKRINQALEDHKSFNAICNSQQTEFLSKLSSERELRLQQKFESLDMAIEKANSATEERFKAINNLWSTLTSQQGTFIVRTEYDATYSSMNMQIGALEKRVD